MVNDRQTLDLTPFSRGLAGRPVEWRVSDAPIPYPDAVAEMEARAAAIAEGTAPELVWLLEHPRSTRPAPQASRTTCWMPDIRCSRPAAAAR